jgi:hypothetical protein
MHAYRERERESHIDTDIYIYIEIVPADDAGVVGHTQKEQMPMSSA